MRKMYYDTFAREYVTNCETIAPPERYIPTYCGEPGIYIEQWIVSKYGQEMRMDVAYSKEEYYNKNHHDIQLTSMCERNECRAMYLCGFVLPAEKFVEYVERYGITFDENTQ